MSLLKYQDQPDPEKDKRGPLSFARAHADGMPFRGEPTMLREEEYHQVCETVYDVEIDIFDISIPDQKAKLKEILDRAANQWYRILAMDRKWATDANGNDTVKVYVTWAAPYKEVNKSKMEPGAAG